MAGESGVSSNRSVEFSKDVIRVEAIKKAAYRYSDRLSCDIVVKGDIVSVLLNPLTSISGPDLDLLVEKFKIEVLDQELRIAIADETAAYRNAILAYAFSKTNLQGE